MLLTGCTAQASDFWEAYVTRLTYNYSVKVGAIPDSRDFNRRLSNDEMFSILTKSFSQALGSRVTDVAHQRSAVAIVCMFHPEPERCFTEYVLNYTFDEVHFVNSPGISQKLLKKLSKYYSYTLNDDDKALDRREQASRSVPPWKSFNPRFGFNLNEREIMVTAPFYSFAGAFVEPRYGTRRGPSVSLIYERYFIDFQKEGVSLKYRTDRQSFGRGYLSITIRPEGEITISNELIFK